MIPFKIVAFDHVWNGFLLEEVDSIYFVIPHALIDLTTGVVEYPKENKLWTFNKNHNTFRELVVIGDKEVWRK